MEKRSRGLAIVLTLVMVSSIGIVGCGTKKVAVQSSEKSTMGDKEKKGKVSVMVYDRGIIPGSEGTYADNRWTKWIQANAPLEEVKFVVVPRVEAVQKMNMLFASGEGPDVVANYEDTVPFIAKGQALPLDDLIDKYMPNYKATLQKYPLLKKGTTVNGKIYTVGGAPITTFNHSVAIRTDWLEKLNLQVPKTEEELFAVAKAFTEKDPDGNGKNDTYGISMNIDAQKMLSHMFGYGNPEKYKIENGKLSYAWDRIGDWLAYSKRFVDAKLVDPDFLLDKGDKALADFTNGKLGIYFTGKFNSTGLSVYTNFKKNNPNGKLDTFDLPKTKYGNYTAYVNGGFQTFGFINSATKDSVAAARYINWLIGYDVQDYLTFGPEGVYKKKDSEGTYAVVDAAKNKVEFDYSNDYHTISASGFSQRSNYSPQANLLFNQLLKGIDPLGFEYGDLAFKMTQVANKPNVTEPRKWQNTLPALSSADVLKKTSGTVAVEDLILKALASPKTTAESAIVQAKDAWKKSGGEDVDTFYNDYYQKNKDSMILSADYEKAKMTPEILPLAKKNSKIK